MIDAAHPVAWGDAEVDAEGTVWVASEEWTASSDQSPIDSGEQVEVVSVEGLRLRVRRLKPDHSSEEE